jgi:hypothetical protein
MPSTNVVEIARRISILMESVTMLTIVLIIMEMEFVCMSTVALIRVFATITLLLM